jgi:hypothetical protein
MAANITTVASQDQDNNPHVRLQMAMDSVNTDDTYIGFSSAANNGFVVNEDAPYKQGTGKIGMASFSSDGIEVAINKMQLPKLQQTIIPLDVSARSQGSFSLNMTEIEAIPEIYEIWLMDSWRKDSLDIRHNPTYGFNVTSDTASQGNQRFKLVIRENTMMMMQLLSFGAAKTSGGSQVAWTTENEQNYTNFTVERSTDGGSNFKALGGVASNGQGTYGFLDPSPVKGANLYRLMMQDLNGTITYSNVVTLMYGSEANSLTAGSIMLYPNPASSVLNLNIKPAFAPVANASYTIIIANASGLIIKTGKSTLETWQTSLNGLMPGSYAIQVVDNNNILIGRSTFVKL